MSSRLFSSPWKRFSRVIWVRIEAARGRSVCTTRIGGAKNGVPGIPVERNRARTELTGFPRCRGTLAVCRAEKKVRGFDSVARHPNRKRIGCKRIYVCR